MHPLHQLLLLLSMMLCLVGAGFPAPTTQRMRDPVSTPVAAEPTTPPQPTGDPQPTEEPEPTLKPTVVPSPTAEPSLTVEPSPTLEPSPTAEPTPTLPNTPTSAPSATAEPTAAPSPTPEASQSSQPTSVSTATGTPEMTITSTVIDPSTPSPTMTGITTTPTATVAAPTSPPPTPTSTSAPATTPTSGSTPTMTVTAVPDQTPTATVDLMPTLTATTVISDTASPTASVTTTPTTTPTITPTAGTLQITTIDVPSFPPLQLNGTDQTLSVALGGFTVSDLRGTGEGWRVMVEASQLAEVDPDSGAYVVGGKQLPRGSLRMSETKIGTAEGVSSDPEIADGPYIIDDGSAVEIARAENGAGAGVYHFAATTLTLKIPASAYARTYRTEITLSIISGP